MKCPRCDNDKTYVLKTTITETRMVDSTKQRRRICNRCEIPFMTFEIQESEFERLCNLITLEGPTRSPLHIRKLEETSGFISKTSTS